MEKLQAALEKARGQRALAQGQGQGGAPRQPRITPAGTAAGTAVAGAPGRWSELAELTLDRAWLARRRIVTLDQGAAAGPFDMLRTKIVQMMQANGWRRLAITSPDMGCGKTTLATNLALSLARQRELRTVLYDFDLRRPSLVRTLGLPAADLRAGSADLLEGRAGFAEVGLRLGETLALVPALRAEPGSAELLQSAGCAEVLARVEAEFDPSIEIFDLPPLLACDDTVGFLGHVDCAMLVIESDVTKVEAIDRCERDLAERTNVLGVVVNKNRFDEAADGSAYYY